MLPRRRPAWASPHQKQVEAWVETPVRVREARLRVERHLSRRVPHVSGNRRAGGCGLEENQATEETVVMKMKGHEALVLVLRRIFVRSLYGLGMVLFS